MEEKTGAGRVWVSMSKAGEIVHPNETIWWMDELDVLRG